MIAFITMGLAPSPTAPPTPVTITLVGGLFNASGGIETEGTYNMSPVEVKGSTFHCTNNFVASDGSGTFTALSVYQAGTLRGTWHIVDATGSFANLRGNGSLVMYAGGETWEGKIF